MPYRHDQSGNPDLWLCQSCEHADAVLGGGHIFWRARRSRYHTAGTIECVHVSEHFWGRFALGRYKIRGLWSNHQPKVKAHYITFPTNFSFSRISEVRIGTLRVPMRTSWKLLSFKIMAASLLG